MWARATPDEIPLIRPEIRKTNSLIQLLFKRKSHRNFKPQSLTPDQISYLLWAAQGVLPDGRCTAPSAGAIFPFQILLSIGPLQQIWPQGLYRFDPFTFKLKKEFAGDFQNKLYRAALKQECLIQAPVSIVLVADFNKIANVYGKRGLIYLYLEGGHIGQNIYLMATFLNLGTVAVGAFDDQMMKKILNLTEGELPVYIFPVGIPSD